VKSPRLIYFWHGKLDGFTRVPVGTHGVQSFLLFTARAVRLPTCAVLAAPAPNNLFFLFAACDRKVARVWPQATSANKSSLFLPRAPKAARVRRSRQCQIFFRRGEPHGSTQVLTHPRRTESSFLLRVRPSGRPRVAAGHQCQIIFSFFSARAARRPCVLRQQHPRLKSLLFAACREAASAE
jgi:hypothetical protein